MPKQGKMSEKKKGIKKTPSPDRDHDPDAEQSTKKVKKILAIVPSGTELCIVLPETALSTTRATMILMEDLEVSLPIK